MLLVIGVRPICQLAIMLPLATLRLPEATQAVSPRLRARVTRKARLICLRLVPIMIRRMARGLPTWLPRLVH